MCSPAKHIWSPSESSFVKSSLCVSKFVCMCEGGAGDKEREMRRGREREGEREFTFQWVRTRPQHPGAAWHSGDLALSCLRRSRPPLWLWEAALGACAGAGRSSSPRHCCRFCPNGRCRGPPGQPALWKHPFHSPHNSLSKNNQQMFKTTWRQQHPPPGIRIHWSQGMERTDLPSNL